MTDYLFILIHFSVFRPADVHLPSGDPGWSVGVHLLPAGKVFVTHCLNLHYRILQNNEISRTNLSVHLSCLALFICIFFLVQLSEELKSNLKRTMVDKYQQPDQNHVTQAVDKLQQEVKKTKKTINNNNNFIQCLFVHTVNFSDGFICFIFLLCFSLSAVEVTTRLIGRRAFGFALISPRDGFLTAAVRRPQSCVEKETIPPTFTKWRWVRTSQRSCGVPQGSLGSSQKHLDRRL